VHRFLLSYSQSIATTPSPSLTMPTRDSLQSRGSRETVVEVPFTSMHASWRVMSMCVILPVPTADACIAFFANVKTVDHIENTTQGR
jgi:hypothetical protein